MIALRQAAGALRSWRLEDCVLYVTLEPCPMCAGAIVQARVPFVVYGCADPKAGACHTLYQITTDERLNHRCRVLAGVRGEESAALLRQFFMDRRSEGKK
jgi:tRNA(adenine34) deaminase